MTQRVQILITREADGSIDLQGPLDSPIVFLGLLEMAKASYIAGLTSQEAEGPRIITAPAALGAAVRTKR